MYCCFLRNNSPTNSMIATFKRAYLERDFQRFDLWTNKLIAAQWTASLAVPLPMLTPAGRLCFETDHNGDDPRGLLRPRRLFHLRQFRLRFSMAAIMLVSAVQSLKIREPLALSQIAQSHTVNQQISPRGPIVSIDLLPGGGAYFRGAYLMIYGRQFACQSYGSSHGESISFAKLDKPLTVVGTEMERNGCEECCYRF